MNMREENREENQEENQKEELSEDISSIDQNIMALDYKGKVIGCAAIIGEKRAGQLFSVIEVRDDSEFQDIFNLLVEQLSPDAVVISSRLESEILQFINEKADKLGYSLITRPSYEFSQSKAIQKVNQLHLYDPRTYICINYEDIRNNLESDDCEQNFGNPSSFDFL